MRAVTTKAKTATNKQVPESREVTNKQAPETKETTTHKSRRYVSPLTDVAEIDLVGAVMADQNVPKKYYDDEKITLLFNKRTGEITVDAQNMSLRFCGIREHHVRDLLKIDGTGAQQLSEDEQKLIDLYRARKELALQVEDLKHQAEDKDAEIARMLWTVPVTQVEVAVKQ